MLCYEQDQFICLIPLHFELPMLTTNLLFDTILCSSCKSNLNWDQWQPISRIMALHNNPCQRVVFVSEDSLTDPLKFSLSFYGYQKLAFLFLFTQPGICLDATVLRSGNILATASISVSTNASGADVLTTPATN